MSSQTQNLRVLCLDGGGVRGISSLLVLQALFVEMEIDKQPYEFFDIIGGTSTGGIIAIMLGRLRMSIADCIAEYNTLTKEVFGNPHRFGDSKYDHRTLERVLKRVIKEQLAKWPENKGLSETEVTKLEDAPLLDESLVDPKHSGKKGCPTVVFTIPLLHANPSTPTSLRSFRRTNTVSDKLPIWQAARATSAATTYFEPMPIALNSPSLLEYCDGAFGFNNAGDVMLEEVRQLKARKDLNYNSLDHIGLFLSVGTGFHEVIRLKPETVSEKLSQYARMPLRAVPAMQAIVTSTQNTHIQLQRLFRGDVSRYWRFNVEGAIGQIDLDDYKSMDNLEIDTVEYMKTQEDTVNRYVNRVQELESDNSLESRFQKLHNPSIQTASSVIGREDIRPSPFLKLTGRSEHIGPPLPGKSEYWSRIKRPAVELYKQVFDDMPKVQGNMVSYNGFESHFTKLNISRSQAWMIWDRLSLHGHYAPKNYVLACICMAHFESYVPGIRPKTHEGLPGISHDMENRLAHFGDWAPCQCRPECAMEWTFLVGSWAPPREGDDSNCKIVQRRARSGHPTLDEEDAWNRTRVRWYADPERPQKINL